MSLASGCTRSGSSSNSCFIIAWIFSRIWDLDRDTGSSIGARILVIEGLNSSPNVRLTGRLPPGQNRAEFYTVSRFTHAYERAPFLHGIHEAIALPRRRNVQVWLATTALARLSVMNSARCCTERNASRVS